MLQFRCDKFGGSYSTYEIVTYLDASQQHLLNYNTLGAASNYFDYLLFCHFFLDLLLSPQNVKRDVERLLVTISKTQGATPNQIFASKMTQKVDQLSKYLVNSLLID